MSLTDKKTLEHLLKISETFDKPLNKVALDYYRAYNGCNSTYVLGVLSHSYELDRLKKRNDLK